VARVWPEDIKPRVFEGEPPEPDPTGAFEPAAGARGDGAGEASEAREDSSGQAAFVDPGTPDEDEAAIPVRPTVRYLGARAIMVPLLYPVEIAGLGEVCEVLIDQPALWDIQDWAAGRLRTNYELMARMVGLDPTALGALRWPDIERIATITTDMLPEAMREAIAAMKVKG
jgi:hypothetical protein